MLVRAQTFVKKHFTLPTMKSVCLLITLFVTMYFETLQLTHEASTLRLVIFPPTQNLDSEQI